MIFAPQDLEVLAFWVRNRPVIVQSDLAEIYSRPVDAMSSDGGGGSRCLSARAVWRLALSGGSRCLAARAVWRLALSGGSRFRPWVARSSYCRAALAAQ
jgi:hypothetical protein